MHSREDLVERGRMALPPDRGALRALSFDAIEPQRAVAGFREPSRVEVDAQEVEPAVIAVELSRSVEVGRIQGDHVLRIAAAVERIEEPPVEVSVRARRGRGVFGRVGRGLARRKGEGVAEPGWRIRCAYRVC